MSANRRGRADHTLQPQPLLSEARQEIPGEKCIKMINPFAGPVYLLGRRFSEFAPKSPLAYQFHTSCTQWNIINGHCPVPTSMPTVQRSEVVRLATVEVPIWSQNGHCKAWSNAACSLEQAKGYQLLWLPFITTSHYSPYHMKEQPSSHWLFCN